MTYPYWLIPLLLALVLLFLAIPLASRTPQVTYLWAVFALVLDFVVLALLLFSAVAAPA